MPSVVLSKKEIEYLDQHVQQAESEKICLCMALLAFLSDGSGHVCAFFSELKKKQLPFSTSSCLFGDNPFRLFPEVSGEEA